MIPLLPKFFLHSNEPTFYDGDAATMLELASRLHGKTNEVIEEFNTLEKNTSDHLENQDKTIDDRLSAQDNNIHKMLNETMPNEVEAEFKQNLDNGTFEEMVDTYAGELTSRVDNLLGSVKEGSTSLDAEVIDLRLDVSGKVHTTAGEAVRESVKVKADTTELNRFFDLDVMRGQYVNQYPHGDLVAQYTGGTYQNVIGETFPLNRGTYTAFISGMRGFRGYVEKVGGLTDGHVRYLVFDNPGIYVFTLAEDVPDMEIRLMVAGADEKEPGMYGLYGITIVNGDYTLDKLLPDYVTGVDQAITCKRDIKMGKNLFNKNSKFNVKGAYLLDAGEYAYDNPNYLVSHYIEVEPETDYNYINIQGSASCVAFYDSGNAFLGAINGQSITNGTFTTPAGAVKMRVSVDMRKIDTAQVIKGSYPEDYEPYTDSQDIVDLQKDVNLIKSNMGVGETKPSFLSVEGDGNLEIKKLVNVKKNNTISFYGRFSTFNGLRIGHGASSVGGSYIEIDNTNVTYSFVGNEVVPYESVAHGLNISDFIEVNIKVDTLATVTITTASGSSSIPTPHWSGCNGYVFATGINTTLRDCKLSWATKDINAPVWVFGDSYMTTNTSDRTPKNIIDMGYDNWLVSGYPGGVGGSEIQSFTNLLELGKPKVAVWCLGMNHPDKDGVLNTSWITTTTAFIDLCVDNGITPVLATIPTTPTVNNDPKNTWVKASGYRYVDNEKAVVNPATGDWYDGLLSGDNLHPSAQGAKVLASRLVLDVPEITL